MERGGTINAESEEGMKGRMKWGEGVAEVTEG
jgi:hypothetical protein